MKLATLFLIILFATTNALAQGAGTIMGAVADERGADVPGASVTLTSESGTQISTTTDMSGNFRFANVKAGAYLIEIRAPGFAVYTSEQIQLGRGKTESIPVKLKVAAINESVVVTATGTAQRADEVAKVVTTLDASEIEAKHELTLTEALRGTPGVRVQQQGSPGALTTVRLRGQRNFDTALLLDGLRVRDAGDINGSALSLFSDLVPFALDHVEILRGAGSSIYGTHAIGGVINLIPDSGSSGLHFAGGFEGGGLGTYREHLRASGGSNHFGFNIGVNRLDVRNGIDGDDAYGNTGIVGRGQYNASPSITITGNFYGTIANARVNDSPFALPAAFNDFVSPAIPGVTFHPDFNNPDQGRRNRLLVGSGRFSHVVTDRISYSVAYQRVSANRRNYNGPAIDPQFAPFVSFEFEFLNVNRGITDTLDGRVNLRIARSNLATAGFEYERESFFQSSQPSFNAFNNTTDRQRTFAIFGQDQLSFLNDRLRLSLGVRGQWYRVRSADRPGFLAGREAESSVTGDGSLAYFINRTGTKLRAHAGNGFRAASLFERFGEGTFAGVGLTRFGDPTLRAEQSISVDGGFDQQLASDRFMFGATYFYTRLQRVIAFTSFFDDPLDLGRFSGFINRPGGISRGVETYLQAAAWKGMDLRASYTFTNSDSNGPGAGGLSREFVIPKHLVGVSLTQRIKSFIFNVDVNRTGSYEAPVFENSFPFRQAFLIFDGYTKADVFASYERRAGERATMVLYGGVENLFDREYYENGFLAPGAVGRAGIRFRF